LRDRASSNRADKVTRLLKELTVYLGEEEDQVRRVEKLKNDGADEADIRQAVSEASKFATNSKGNHWSP
jgi:hypothetical protein